MLRTPIHVRNRMGAENFGLGFAGRDQPQVTQMRAQIGCPWGGRRVGGNCDARPARPFDDGAERFHWHVGAEENRLRLVQNGPAGIRVLGGERLNHTHVFQRQVMSTLRGEHGQIDTRTGSNDSLGVADISAGASRLLDQLAARRVIPYGGDERNVNPQARQVLGDVTRHAAG